MSTPRTDPNSNLEIPGQDVNPERIKPSNFSELLAEAVYIHSTQEVDIQNNDNRGQEIANYFQLIDKAGVGTATRILDKITVQNFPNELQALIGPYAVELKTAIAGFRQNSNGKTDLHNKNNFTILDDFSNRLWPKIEAALVKEGFWAQIKDESVREQMQVTLKVSFMVKAAWYLKFQDTQLQDLEKKANQLDSNHVAATKDMQKGSQEYIAAAREKDRQLAEINLQMAKLREPYSFAFENISRVARYGAEEAQKKAISSDMLKHHGTSEPIVAHGQNTPEQKNADAKKSSFTSTMRTMLASLAKTKAAVTQTAQNVTMPSESKEAKSTPKPPKGMFAIVKTVANFSILKKFKDKMPTLNRTRQQKATQENGASNEVKSVESQKRNTENAKWVSAYPEEMKKTWRQGVRVSDSQVKALRENLDKKMEESKTDFRPNKR